MKKTTPFDEATIEWDIANWKRVLPFWQKELPSIAGSNCLAVGERRGGLSLWLASIGYQVICSDIALEIETCRNRHIQFQVENNIKYCNADILTLPFPDESFDLIVFKSVLGSLGAPDKQLRSIKELRRILRKGGKLLFAENLRASIFHMAFRRFFNRWSRSWYYPSFNELFAYCQEFDRCSTLSLGFFAAFGRTEKQRAILSRVDSIVERFVPMGLRYIFIANCTK